MSKATNSHRSTAAKSNEADEEASVSVGSERITTEIIHIDPKQLKLLERNARFMRHETFKRLVENIKRDGDLTSVPFAVLEGEQYVVLSGNHRVKAAIEAGLSEISVMVTRDPLPHQRKIGIQLSHNALIGEDDPSTLKSLYEELEALDWRSYSGLDDKMLGLLEKVQIGSLAEAQLDFQTLTFTFLPEELARVKAVFEKVKPLVGGANAVYLARWSEYDRTMDALEESGASYGVTNVATALMVILDVYEAHKTDLQAGYTSPEGEAAHKGWVPLSSILGTGKVPASVALVLSRAITRMEEHREITQAAKWRALELWAADYLSGSSNDSNNNTESSDDNSP